jgi:hypothetical protein
MVPQRIELVKASGLTSSYKKKRKKEYWTVDVFKEGRLITEDMFTALQKLDQLVRMNKGQLLITDLFRSWETQAEARKKFEQGKKKAFVAKPGGSFHNAGRAVDISVKQLEFEGIEKDEWVSFFWELAKPLGFHPIVSTPDLGVSEIWHYDFPGNDWKDAYDVLQYGEAAKCCILDVGKWNPNESEEKVRKMFIQAQLIRLGFYEIGKVDGFIGPKTKKVLDFCGVGDFDTAVAAEVLAHRDRK